jgi:hypothetical protein
MFDPMTTEAARIERNQAIASVHAHGTAVPMRPGLLARLVARFRSTAPVTPAAPTAPVVALPATAIDATVTSVTTATSTAAA